MDTNSTPDIEDCLSLQMEELSCHAPDEKTCTSSQKTIISSEKISTSPEKGSTSPEKGSTSSEKGPTSPSYKTNLNMDSYMEEVDMEQINANTFSPFKNPKTAYEFCANILGRHQCSIPDV